MTRKPPEPAPAPDAAAGSTTKSSTGSGSTTVQKPTTEVGTAKILSARYDNTTLFGYAGGKVIASGGYPVKKGYIVGEFIKSDDTNLYNVAKTPYGSYAAILKANSIIS